MTSTSSRHFTPKLSILIQSFLLIWVGWQSIFGLRVETSKVDIEAGSLSLCESWVDSLSRCVQVETPTWLIDWNKLQFLITRYNPWRATRKITIKTCTFLWVSFLNPIYKTKMLMKIQWMTRSKIKSYTQKLLSTSFT